MKEWLRGIYRSAPLVSNPVGKAVCVALSTHEHALALQRAWVPEHLVDYVVAVSGKEPFMLGEFLCYTAEKVAVVVGYPLRGPFQVDALAGLLEEVRERFQPRRISLLAPELPAWRGLKPRGGRDHYFRLELTDQRPPSKVRNMVRRASRELEISETGPMERAHLDLVAEFLARKDLSEETRVLLRGLPSYVGLDGVLLLNAWDRRGRLVAFSIGHMSQGDHGFYMFSFASRRHGVPGSSDLLLCALVDRAKKQGKRFLNMGLGIGPGVRFFKEKWGAKPFVPYLEASSSGWSLGRLLGALLTRPGRGPGDDK